MADRLRTIASVLLVVMFPLMLVVLLAALVVAQILCFQRSTGFALNWAMAIVPAALVMVRGLRTLVAPIDMTPTGTPLTEADHPALWGLVRRLAVVAETEPPDEIYLTADANAAVVEETRMLGLISVRRRMFVGAPLVAGLDTAALSAVLTHELAHYARHHTRLTVLVYRGRLALVSTTAVLHGDVIQWFLRTLLSGWTKLHARLSMGLSRRQEWAADEAAASAVGSATAAGAWRELTAIGEAWQVYLDKHVMMGWGQGLLPDDLVGGYARLRTAEAEWFDELRANPPAAEPDRYDSHPSMPQRIAAFEVRAVEPVIDVGAGPAMELLRDPSRVLDAALVAGLPPTAHTKRRVDWTTLARVVGIAWATRSAEPVLTGAAKLAGRTPTMRYLLSALDDGRVTELAGTQLRRGVTPRMARELARPPLRTELFAVVCGVLTTASAGAWELVWRSGVRFAIGPEFAEAIDAAVAEPPDTTALRELLAGAGVDLDRTLTWGSDDGTAQVDVQPQAPGGRAVPG